jgi:glycerophosphoryl diester phosphodiesterase
MICFTHHKIEKYPSLIKQAYNISGGTMKQTLFSLYQSLTYNIKQLVIFETLYRLFGLATIIPLSRFFFILSIRLSGFTYITNSTIIDYILKPTTIILFIILMILFSVYVAIEFIFLSVIFDYGYHERDLRFRELFHVGIRKTIEMIKKYHFKIMFPAVLFFGLVELMHVVGIAQTFSIPDVITEQLKNYPSLLSIAIIIVVIFGFLLIESIFLIHFFNIEKLSLKTAYIESRKILKKYRLIMIIEIIVLNFILNLLLYLFYVLILLIVGFFVSITRGEAYVLSFVLTIFYSLYSFVAFIASITLIPINFALVSTWYYSRRQFKKTHPKNPFFQILAKPIFESKMLRKSLIVLILVLFSINLVNIVSSINQRTPLEILNYPVIVAHRGASFDAPENTIAAIEYAILAQADYVEIDVRMTKDHVPIIIHDKTTGRTTNDTSNRVVKDLTLEQIKALDAGSWFSESFAFEQIPTLEEALLATKGRIDVFLDLKESTIFFEELVIEIVESLDMASNITILSFNNLQLRRFKEKNPELKTLLLITSFFGDMEKLANYDYIDHFGLHESLFKSNPEYRDIIQSKRKQVFVYTVNSERRLKTVVDLNADGIITDQPILAKEVAFSKNAKDEVVELLSRLFSRNT